MKYAPWIARGAAATCIAAAPALVHTAAQQQPFRTAVDVVELSVAVTSGKTVVADLTATDFEVLDNGVKQDVLGVSRELLPIDVTLVIDTSESLTPALAGAILSGANRVRARLRLDDRVSLVTFNQRIQERLSLLRPPDVGPLALGQPAGQTSLNDAIGVALAIRPPIDRRQMAIVFTDGFDSSSLLTEADVMLLAGRSRTSLFLVSQKFGMTGDSFSPLGAAVPVAPGPRYPTAFFERLAAATGGLAQVVPSFTMTVTGNTVTGSATVFKPNTTLLDEPFLKALDDFRSSYVLRYSLSGVPRAGWHTVAVKVTKRGKTYTTRTRSGYSG